MAMSASASNNHAPPDAQLHSTLQQLLTGSGGETAHNESASSQVQGGASDNHQQQQQRVASPDDHFIPLLGESSLGEAAAFDDLTDCVFDSSSSSDQVSGSSKRSKPSEQQRHVAIGTKRSRPKHKSTYQARKEETAALQSQVARLQEQLGDANGERLACEERALFNSQVENKALRRAVQDQKFSFARVQSAIGDQVIAQAHIPFEMYIKLGKDWHERQATLLAMKDKKLLGAQRYIAERTHYLNPTVPFTEASRFSTPSGDSRALILDVVPFDGIRSVKQVYDALLFYFFNMEISVSEVLGEITIRENDGTRFQGISQNCLVSSVRSDVQVEFNSVTFCQLTEASDSKDDVAVITCDFVNDDELYPYSPATRLRKDVTAAITITLEPRKTVNAAGEETEEFLVVMKRGAQLCLHKCEKAIPAPVMQELGDGIGNWGDAMLKTMRGVLYPEYAGWSVGSVNRVQEEHAAMEK